MNRMTNDNNLLKKIPKNQRNKYSNSRSKRILLHYPSNQQVASFASVINEQKFVLASISKNGVIKFVIKLLMDKSFCESSNINWDAISSKNRYHVVYKSELHVDAEIKKHCLNVLCETMQ